MTSTARLLAVISIAPLAARLLATPESRASVLLIAAVLCWILDVLPDYVVALGVIVVWNVAAIGPSAASLSGFASPVWLLLLGVLAVGGWGVLELIAFAAGDHSAHVSPGERLSHWTRREPASLPVRVVPRVLERIGRLSLRARSGPNLQRRVRAAVAMRTPGLDSGLAAARLSLVEGHWSGAGARGLEAHSPPARVSSSSSSDFASIRSAVSNPSVNQP